MSSPTLSVTPAMQQYHRMKAEHPDALAVLPHGRLLRDVLRGRGHRRQGPRDRAHLALEGQGRHAGPDVRSAVSRGIRLHRAARAPGLSRGALRADGGPAHGEGRRQARGRARRHPRHAARARGARRRRDLVRDGDRPGTGQPGRRLARAHDRASSPSPSGTALRASSGCATSSASRARASCCCAFTRRCPAGCSTPSSRRARSRARRSRSAASSPSGRGASCSPTSASRRSRPSAARRCRAPPPRRAPPCATCARRRSATSPTSPTLLHARLGGRARRSTRSRAATSSSSRAWPTAIGAARCSTCSTTRRPRWARRALREWIAASARRAGADPGPARRRRGAGLPGARPRPPARRARPRPGPRPHPRARHARDRRPARPGGARDLAAAPCPPPARRSPSAWRRSCGCS